MGATPPRQHEPPDRPRHEREGSDQHRRDSGHAAGRHTGPARRRPMIRGEIMDIVTVKQRQQAAWASGDYAAVGARLLLTAELLCEAVDLRAGQRVLDVACGNGNAALAAARRFCQVTGVDDVPVLLDRARQRAAALKADMVEVARSFDDSDDDTLVLRQDYLEAVIHKPATP